MSVDVADVLGLHFRVPRSIFHDPQTALVLRRRLGHVISVTAHSVADNLGDRLCTTGKSVFEFFKNQDSRALADHETVAIAVPRAAGFLRLVIAGGKRPHGSETANTHRRNGSFRASGNHHVGVAVLDDSE